MPSVNLLDLFIHTVESLRGNSWAPLIFISSYTAACFMFPVSIFPVAGGILFGFWKGFLFSCVASLSGAFGPFLLARFIGRDYVLKWLKKNNRWPAMNDLLMNPGFAAFLAIRLIGLPPFVVTNYLAGLSGMSKRVFLTATFVGITPWTLLFVYSSNTFWKILTAAGIGGFRKAVLQNSRPLIVVSFLAAAVMGLMIYLKRRPAGKKITR